MHNIVMHEGNTFEINPLVIRAPESIIGFRPSVYLAGSVTKPVDWRKRFIDMVRDIQLPVGVALLDPVRKDWDDTWVESLADPRFREQVEWELRSMRFADVIAVHFEPGSLAPVSLLELGLYANSGKLLIHCPDGFWKRGYVEAVASFYRIHMVESLEDLAAVSVHRAVSKYVL